MLLSKIGNEDVNAEKERVEDVQETLAGGLAEGDSSNDLKSRDDGPVDKENSTNGDNLPRPFNEMRMRTVSESSSNGGKTTGKDVFYFYQGKLVFLLFACMQKCNVLTSSDWFAH